MKIFNIHLSISKILSTAVIIITLFFVVLAITTFAKQILASNHIEITNTNYTTILEDAYNNIDKYLGKNISVIIDRPMGSYHPSNGKMYPINYGYIPNTISGDGEELDCYILGVFEPIKEFKGKCIAVIHRTNDNDDKLVVIPENRNYNNDAIEALVEFQERFFEHIIIREV